LLGHINVITQIDSAKINACESVSAALARRTKPARAKSIQTISNLVIAICEPTIAPQRNRLNKNQILNVA